MAAIDSILGLVAQQGATELRVGTDREPEMYRGATRLRLALDSTPDDTLRLLLGPLLGPDREAILVESGSIEFLHIVPGNGEFHVVMKRREAEPGHALAAFDVVFHRGQPKQSPAPAVPSRAVSALSEPAVPHAPAPISERAELLAEGARVASAASLADPGPGLVALLEHAVSLRASDLHVREGERPALRIDGRLQVILADPVASLGELLGESLWARTQTAIENGCSVDVAFEVPGTGRFRLNVYAASERACASIRVLPATVPALATLQMPMALDELVDLPHGLVIVCGPTGSGKSTTLAALAQEALRRRSIVLISLEDPIEYRLRCGQSGSLVRQREVGRDVRDFPTGLRDALREDPDVLLIGEMRDADSIGLTLTAAETGHLVLASLHSRSTASAVERVVDTYPPERQGQIRVQLADSLRAVISQRLLPHACGEGRIPAVEVLRVTYNVANVIREGRTAQLATAMQSGRKEGQLPLERCLADLVRSGQVRIEDARVVANDQAALGSYLQG
ncbi:MAG: PilT/PilU family type 4a pilus ATPase [Deltaproteobacteria bacterium]|nr:PilT/PilU family type 4a pilus ATPase [Deltaproteobacteria bacterium]